MKSLAFSIVAWQVFLILNVLEHNKSCWEWFERILSFPFPFFFLLFISFFPYPFLFLNLICFFSSLPPPLYLDPFHSANSIVFKPKTASVLIKIYALPFVYLGLLLLSLKPSNVNVRVHQALPCSKQPLTLPTLK